MLRLHTMLMYHYASILYSELTYLLKVVLKFTLSIVIRELVTMGYFILARSLEPPPSNVLIVPAEVATKLFSLVFSGHDTMNIFSERNNYVKIFG